MIRLRWTLALATVLLALTGGCGHTLSPLDAKVERGPIYLSVIREHLTAGRSYSTDVGIHNFLNCSGGSAMTYVLERSKGASVVTGTTGVGGAA